MPDLSIWDNVKAALKTRLPEHSYRMWIEPLAMRAIESGRIVISSPNFYSRKRVMENYGSLIEEELGRVIGETCRLSIEIGTGPGAAVPKKEGESPQYQLALPDFVVRPHNGRMFRRDFTFDQFVVGSNNDFAFSASLSLATHRNAHQNSLFLLSGTGMGKSHLTQAIGHQILTANPEEKVYYLTAEDFANEMIQAFRHDDFHAFKEKYRNGCDVLLLEDIHQLSGKERTQVELSHTLDSLMEADKKIIFSSCYLPSEIPKLNDTLRSRLGFGVISNIDPPDFRTRVRILKRKAQLRGIRVPEDVVQYLAGELTQDIRQLEGGLIGVLAKSSLLGAPIDLNLAESVVRNIARSQKKITVESIKHLVCEQYRISTVDMVSKSRRKCFVRPRQVAIYLARRYTDAPCQAIGRSFNRYHATVLHSINAVEKEMLQDAALRQQVDYLCRKLETNQFKRLMEAA